MRTVPPEQVVGERQEGEVFVFLFQYFQRPHPFIFPVGATLCWDGPNINRALVGRFGNYMGITGSSNRTWPLFLSHSYVGQACEVEREVSNKWG
jgi:hypothetical protein